MHEGPEVTGRISSEGARACNLLREQAASAPSGADGLTFLPCLADGRTTH